jgi:hypothetical protein
MTAEAFRRFGPRPFGMALTDDGGMRVGCDSTGCNSDQAEIVVRVSSMVFDLTTWKLGTIPGMQVLGVRLGRLGFTRPMPTCQGWMTTWSVGAWVAARWLDGVEVRRRMATIIVKAWR